MVIIGVGGNGGGFGIGVGWLSVWIVGGRLGLMVMLVKVEVSV